MIFLISNDHTRSLAATGVLHVAADCPVLAPAKRRGWEATLSDIASVRALRSVRPENAGRGNPRRRSSDRVELTTNRPRSSAKSRVKISLPRAMHRHSHLSPIPPPVA